MRRGRSCATVRRLRRWYFTGIARAIERTCGKSRRRRRREKERRTEEAAKPRSKLVLVRRERQPIALVIGEAPFSVAPCTVRPLSPSVSSCVRRSLPLPLLLVRVRSRSLSRTTNRGAESTAPASVARDFKNVTVRVLAVGRTDGRTDGAVRAEGSRRRWVSSAVVATSCHGERVSRSEEDRRRRGGEKDGRCERKMSLGDTRARMTGSDRRSDGRESEVVRVSPRRRWWWWWWQRSSLSPTSSSSLRGAAGSVVPALATARVTPDRRERERRYRVFLPRASATKSDSSYRATATSSSRRQLARVAAACS